MKFSIRDLLWLTILAAVAVTWWLDQRASVSRLEELQAQIQFERWERQLEVGRRVARANAQARIRAVDVLVEEEVRYRAEIQKLREFIDSQIIESSQAIDPANGRWYYLH